MDSYDAMALLLALSLGGSAPNTLVGGQLYCAETSDIQDAVNRPGDSTDAEYYRWLQRTGHPMQSCIWSSGFAMQLLEKDYVPVRRDESVEISVYLNLLTGTRWFSWRYDRN